MQKTTIMPLVAALLVSCTQGDQIARGQSADDVASQAALTATLQGISKRGVVVGFSVAVVNATETTYNESFGYRDLKSRSRYSNDTVQRVASISKTFIGIALLKAQELGKLQLDDPINNYLSFEVANPRFSDSPITVRQLATHTSSILDADSFWKNDYSLIENRHAEGVGIPDYFNAPRPRISVAAFLEQLLTDDGELSDGLSFSAHEPGKKFIYSNVGSNLCAVVIEAATGVPYETFTENYILKPLQMDDTRWFPATDKGGRSTLYASKGQVMADYTVVGFPASGLITSSADLAVYLTELIRGYSGTGRLLTKESYQELFEKQLVKSQLPDGVDANVGIFMDYSRKGIGYNGYDPGAIAYMYFDPDSLTGRVVMINTDTDFDEEVKPTLDKIYTILGETQNSPSERPTP